MFEPAAQVMSFTPFSALLGGALIGLAASILLWLNGRIAGVSGIVGTLFARGDGGWRVSFVVGLLAGGATVSWLLPSAIGTSPASLPLLAGAGVLVGFGTQLGSGCTSGHGVCGLSRLSLRSLVATLTFMATGAIAVLVVRHLGGGS